DGLHVARIVEDEASRAVWDHAVVPDAWDLLVGERAVRLDGRDVLAGDGVGRLDLTGTDVREPDVTVGDRLDDDLVEVRELVAVRGGAPPVRVLLERVVIVLHRLGEDERTAARVERLAGEVGTAGLH